METTLHAPEDILPQLIPLIDKSLGAGKPHKTHGRKWGDNGTTLCLEAGAGAGHEAFIHIKDKDDYEFIRAELLRLRFKIKQEEQTLPEYSGKGPNVKEEKVSYFSVYLGDGQEGKITSALTDGSDCLGVIHNPNY